MTSRAERHLDWATAAFPALLAAVLCLIDLTSRSIGFDEAASVSIAAQHGGALGSAIAHDGGNMSGYYVLAHVLLGLFGNSTFAIRLPSVISIAATAGITTLIAIRLFDRRVALIAGTLTAVSLPIVFWGQDARGYAPMVALAAGSFLAFVHLAEDGRAGRGAWIAYFVTTTLAAYCGFVVVLIVPAQLVTLLWRRRAIGAVAASLAASVVCWIPLAVLALRRGSNQLFWVPHLSLTVEKQMLEALTSAGLQPSFRATATMWVLILLTVAIVVAVAVLHVRRASRPRALRGAQAAVVPASMRWAAERTELWGQALVLLWLFVPVGLAFVVSLVAQPIFIPRNLLMCLPAAALVLAVGLADRRLPVAVTWAGVAVVIALRVVALGPSYGVSPENWQAATAHVVAQAEPGDCAVFYPEDARMAFEYYVDQRNSTLARAPRSVLPAVPWGFVKPYVEQYQTLSPAQVSAVRAKCPRLWLISSHEGQPRGASSESRAHWFRFVGLRSALEHAYGRHRRVQFGYAATIYVDLLGGGSRSGSGGRAAVAAASRSPLGARPKAAASRR